jgi:penicillin-binding protein-related factor A (putative recombinase)
MAYLPFNDDDLLTISEALDIAEDATGNFYKFSLGQWKRHRYDVKTLSSLKADEITQRAFALLNKGARVVSSFESKTKNRDFYLICLQDHQILKALNRDKALGFLPLLVYVFTHELVHIVRFCNFFQRFDVSGKEKDKEEAIVHETTFEVLENLALPKLDYVLDSYQGHRICEMVVS